MSVLKLYRGLSTQEFNLATDDLLAQNRNVWSAILVLRAKGDFEYPHELDNSIRSLHNNLRLERQYFTDSKKIAEGYARKVDGLLLEVSVPLKDLLKYFDIEFQNFGRRKKQFEIVYRVKGASLAKFGQRWKLKTKKIK